MKTRVFISHSSKDKTVAAEVCQFLEANGVNCWIAPRNVIPGKNYGAAIVDAIDECGVFVLILSNESNQSGQVVREVERAAAANAVIIPFRIDNVQPSRDLEFYVSSSHWLDAADGSRAKHLQDLLSAITNWHGREKGSPASVSPPLPVAAEASSKASNRTFTLPLVIGALVVVAGTVAYLALHHSAPDPTVATPVNTPSPTGIPSSSPSQPLSVQSSPPLSINTPSSESPIVAPVVQRVTASSERAPQMYQGSWRHYTPRHAFDNDITTAWVPAGSGGGEWIEVRFQQPTTLSSVSVYGGYGVDLARFHSNNRVRQLRVTFSNGFNRMLRLQDEPRLQRFDLPAHPTVDWIRFEIMSVYPGSKFDETPISEIKFNESE